MTQPDLMTMRLKPDPRVAVRKINEQVFAVTPFDWQLHRFNEVATRIWELAEDERTVADVLRVIGEEFEAEADVVRRDCLAFISMLKEKGLVELTPA